MTAHDKRREEVYAEEERDIIDKLHAAERAGDFDEARTWAQEYQRHCMQVVYI